MGKAPEELKKRTKEVAKSPISPVWVGKLLALVAVISSACVSPIPQHATQPASASHGKGAVDSIRTIDP